jgi:hypothetical protein
MSDIINFNKEIYTKNGHKVSNIHVQQISVAFPVSGIVNISKRVKKELQWTLDGKLNLDSPSIWDLTN